MNFRTKDIKIHKVDRPKPDQFKYNVPIQTTKNDLKLQTTKQIHNSGKRSVIYKYEKPPELNFKSSQKLATSNLDNFKPSLNKILVIIANGPSKAEARFDLLKNPNIDTMCINKPDERVWPSTYWLFCDSSQQRMHKKFWDEYNGIIVNTSSVNTTKHNVIRIKTLAGREFSKNLRDGISIGRTSTYAAMQVALWLGYEKIFIFGIDMCKVDNKLYQWGSNPEVKDDVRLKRFDEEALSYNRAAEILNEEERKKFYFCSIYNPYPFVDKFNRLDQKNAHEFILNSI